MLIGIKKTPTPGQPDKVEVFYCGHNGGELLSKHAELLKGNKDGKARFVMLRNPTTIPLPSVETSTEDHPDVITARKRQAEMANAAAEKAAKQPELPKKKK